ncbi:hypothetical protein AB0F17_28885 [Nonomuraea sp. NPDC026600]|uniref:hypothetical protein n=1 Tax=Nonomuraea sp. NPDC026600 TaxID=3155363 RepID=UPI0033D8B90D
MIPFDRELSRCKWPDNGCGRRIFWTITESGARQALDAKPHDEGSVAAYRSAPRTWSSRVITKAGALPPYPHEGLFRPHAETCPKLRARSAAAAEAATPEIPGLLPGAIVVDFAAARRRRAATARSRPP